jgi:cytochrome c-type protein NapC
MPTSLQTSPSLFHRLGTLLRRRWQMLLLMSASGAIGWGMFATWLTVIEYTNHTEFCISCHVMASTVYPEYKKSSHYTNKFGVHAGCPDCHVPQYSWFDEAVAKVGTAKELYAYFFQGMSKPENFEKIRPRLASEVWAKFATTTARECRHCHDYSNMAGSEQAPSARVMHADAAGRNQNCVECHKGITHKNYAVKAEEPASTDFDVQ